MYCRSCGKEMSEQADYCVVCGVSKGKGHAYCGQCGSLTTEYVDVCINCGTKLRQGSAEAKSSIVAGLLGIFLGGLGIHRFYLGYTKVGIVLLLCSTIGSFFTFGISAIVASIWGLVEGILILCEKNITTDANGQPLER